MMKKITLALLLGLTLSACATACSSPQATTTDAAGALPGTPHATTRYALQGFTRIDVGGLVELHVTQADTFGVSVDERLSSTLLTEVLLDGRTLRINTRSLKKNASLNAAEAAPVVSVSLPSIESLAASGAVKVHLGDLHVARLMLRLSGAARLTGGSVQSRALTIDAAGASHAVLERVASESLDVQLSGASKLETRAQTDQTASLLASGASKATLDLHAASFKLDCSGATKVKVAFDGGTIDARNSGAGRVTLDVDCQRLTARNSGAAAFTIGGTADQTDIDLSGAAKIDTSRLNQF